MLACTPFRLIHMAIARSISTDELPAADRFAQWREERARSIFGVTVELDPARRLSFHGRMDALAVGSSTLVEMHSASYAVTRTEADIERTPGDSLCIYQQLDGSSWFSAGPREFVVASGGVATSHSDLAYVTAPVDEGGFHLRLLKIPYARFRHLAEKPMTLWAAPLEPSPGVNALLAAVFDAFVKEARALDGASANAAIETLAQLALIARGQADRRTPEGRAACRDGALMAARKYIDRHIRKPDLTAEKVASALGISVRQLHLLFEPSGTSFAHYVRAARLAHAHRLLILSPQVTITEVAYASGWDSLATFHRVFRLAYGMSPGELRDRARR